MSERAWTNMEIKNLTGLLEKGRRLDLSFVIICHSGYTLIAVLLVHKNFHKIFLIRFILGSEHKLRKRGVCKPTKTGTLGYRGRGPGWGRSGFRYL